MKRAIFNHHLFICLLLLSILRPTPAIGCSTPVFRYALERWPAFLYIAEVIHDGHLNSDQKRALELLKESATGKEKANLRIKETTNTGNNTIGVGVLPVIRLYYPAENKNPRVLWQGPLTEANVHRLIDSSARKQIVDNIQKGDAIVWIFLAGEDKDKNETSYQILDAGLKKLSTELKLSTSATNASGEPLDIHILNQTLHFSMVTVSREDPEEEIFIRMLLGTEADLPYVKSPLAFPVFGRGRLLYALAGKGIKYKMIETACNSVIGWCSCTVKDDNPGNDLLIRADWDKAIGDSSWIQELELPEITGMSDFVTAETQQKQDTMRPGQTIIPAAKNEIPSPEIIKEEDGITKKEQSEAVTIDDVPTVKKETTPPETTYEATEDSSYTLVRNSLIMVASLLLLVLLIVIYLKKRNSNG